MVYVQSEAPSFRKLTYILMIVNRSAKEVSEIMIPHVAAVSVGGSMKLDCCPFGGVPVGN